MTLHLLITGVTGFVGKAVCDEAVHQGFSVKGTLRRQGKLPCHHIELRQTGEINDTTKWGDVLYGTDAVIHLAARVHVMNEHGKDSLAAFRSVNVAGSLNLARRAAASGVKRFVFVSSVKVNGESTQIDRPFHASDDSAPVDPYGVSKLEAEIGLREIAAQTGMEVVIIRPPLVYGPAVKANFLAMMNLLVKGVPLPLGAIYNSRSFVGLDNLVDLIVRCIDHPMAANQTFLVSDGEDVSTTQLLRRMGDALGRPARLLPVPVWMLEVGGALLGRRDLTQRLCGNLQVDISKAKELLGWSPPVSMDEGLRRTAGHYLEGMSSKRQ